MTTNAKYNRYIELGETLGSFINRTEQLVADAFRPMFAWGERYWKARNHNGQYWPA